MTQPRKRLPRAKASTGPEGNRALVKEVGETKVLSEDQGMQTASKVACAECPLRKDSVPGYLGGYSPEAYLDILYSNISLACHSSPGFKEGVISTQRVCTGVAAFRANVGHVCFSAAHKSTVAVGEDDRFFDSPDDFYYHHEAGQRRGKD